MKPGQTGFGNRARPAAPTEDISEWEAKAIAREIIGARKRSGKTQEEIAAAMGVAQSAIAKLESGRSLARLSTLQRFARASSTQLNVSLDPVSNHINETGNRNMTDTRSRNEFYTDRRHFLGGALGLAGMLGFDNVRNVTAQEATAAATAVDDYVWTQPQYDPEPALFDVLERNEETVTVETIDGVIEFPANPQRIVSLSWEYVPLFELGISEPIVGIGYFDAYETPLWNSGELTESMHEALAAATLLPNPSKPNIEEILLLEPDLILTTPQWSDETASSLAKVAPTLRGQTHGPSVPRAGVRDFGALFGRDDEWPTTLEEHDAFIQRAREAIAPHVEGRKVVSLQPNGENFRVVPSYYVQNGETFAHSYGAYHLHRELGISPSNVVEQLADEDRESFFLSLSMEQIGEIDADIIFVYDLPGGEDYDEFVANPLVQLTTAGTTGQIYGFNGMEFGLGMAGIRAGVASIVESLTGESFE